MLLFGFSSDSTQSSPSKEPSTNALNLHSTISFAFKGKHSSALPGQSIFNEEEAANRRKLKFPKRRKLAPKKAPGLSFVPKSEDHEKPAADVSAEQAAAAAAAAQEAEDEELYPSHPTAAAGDDVKAAAGATATKPHFKKMTFVQSSENLGGEQSTSAGAAGSKPDLLKFVKVTATLESVDFSLDLHTCTCSTLS